MSDANLLSYINCSKKFLWSHSVQSIEKFIRKNQLLPFIKNKPVMLLESQYHYDTRNYFTSFFGKKIIKLAADYEFINENIDKNFIAKKKAIFTTRSDRNLNFLLSSWEKIVQRSSNSELYINPPYNLSEKESQMNVKLRVKSDKNKLIDELKNSRVMLNPGHKGEVFCLAAVEAKELCLPIVTMGYGALKERVEHGVTGYIANNQNEFIDYSLDILNNDETYKKFRNNLFNKRGMRTYKNVAEDLINIITT
jgi:glycosyltransferase involved in cell wall biosynthesis